MYACFVYELYFVKIIMYICVHVTAVLCWVSSYNTSVIIAVICYCSAAFLFNCYLFCSSSPQVLENFSADLTNTFYVFFANGTDAKYA